MEITKNADSPALSAALLEIASSLQIFLDGFSKFSSAIGNLQDRVYMEESAAVADKPEIRANSSLVCDNCGKLVVVTDKTLNSGTLPCPACGCDLLSVSVDFDTSDILL